jgi:hypothetical protein
MQASSTTTTAVPATQTTMTTVLSMEEVVERVGEVGTFFPKLEQILTFLLTETCNIRQEEHEM